MAKEHSFWNAPVDRLKEALDIRTQIAALEDKLSSLFGGTSRKSSVGSRKGRRTMSPEGRARVAAAQRARWAKQKGEATSAPPRKGQRGRRSMSAAARAKIAQAQRARWAKQKGQSGSAAGKVASTNSAKRKGGITPEGRKRLSAAMRERWAARKKGVKS